MKKVFKIMIPVVIIIVIYFGFYIYSYFFRLNKDELFILEAVLNESKSNKVVSVLNAKKCYKYFGKITIQYENNDGGLFSETKYIYKDEVYENNGAPSVNTKICDLTEDDSGKLVYGNCKETEEYKNLSKKEKDDIDNQWIIYDRENTIDNTCKEEYVKISKNGLKKINNMIKLK